jgi:hypothetical protein
VRKIMSAAAIERSAVHMLKQLNPKRDAVAVGILRKLTQTDFEITMTRERNGLLAVNTLRCNHCPKAHLHDSQFESVGR